MSIHNTGEKPGGAFLRIVLYVNDELESLVGRYTNLLGQSEGNVMHNMLPTIQ